MTLKKAPPGMSAFDAKKSNFYSYLDMQATYYQIRGLNYSMRYEWRDEIEDDCVAPLVEETDALIIELNWFFHRDDIHIYSMPAPESIANKIETINLFRDKTIEISYILKGLKNEKE